MFRIFEFFFFLNATVQWYCSLNLRFLPFESPDRVSLAAGDRGKAGGRGRWQPEGVGDRVGPVAPAVLADSGGAWWRSASAEVEAVGLSAEYRVEAPRLAGGIKAQPADLAGRRSTAWRRGGWPAGSAGEGVGEKVGDRGGPRRRPTAARGVLGRRTGRALGAAQGAGRGTVPARVLLR